MLVYHYLVGGWLISKIVMAFVRFFIIHRYPLSIDDEFHKEQIRIIEVQGNPLLAVYDLFLFYKDLGICLLFSSRAPTEDKGRRRKIDDRMMIKRRFIS